MKDFSHYTNSGGNPQHTDAEPWLRIRHTHVVLFTADGLFFILISSSSEFKYITGVSYECQQSTNKTDIKSRLNCDFKGCSVSTRIKTAQVTDATFFFYPTPSQYLQCEHMSRA